MTNDYTKEVQRAQDAYVAAQRLAKSANMSIGEAVELTRRDPAFASETNIDAQRQAQSRQASRDQLIRDGVSGLQSEQIQKEWDQQAAEDGKLQAESYATSKNNGTTPRAHDPNNKEEASIREGVLGWLKDRRGQRFRGPQKSSK